MKFPTNKNVNDSKIYVQRPPHKGINVVRKKITNTNAYVYVDSPSVWNKNAPKK